MSSKIVTDHETLNADEDSDKEDLEIDSNYHIPYDIEVTDQELSGNNKRSNVEGGRKEEELEIDYKKRDSEEFLVRNETSEKDLDEGESKPLFYDKRDVRNNKGVYFFKQLYKIRKFDDSSLVVKDLGEF